MPNEANTQSLLPLTSTQLEFDLEQTGFFSNRPPEHFKFQWIWNPWLCPVELLPWLAWSFDVDEFNHDWPSQTKREVIAAAPLVNRKKGTIASMRRAIRAAGLGEMVFTENSGHWAEYDVQFEKHFTLNQYNNAINILYQTGAARNVIRKVTYVQTLLHNRRALHNGQFLYGGM